MIDRWFSRYTPAEVIAALEEQLTVEEIGQSKRVLDTGLTRSS